MSLSAARFAISLLPLFAAAARAVSLSDFTPRVDDLSDKCSAVYNRQIKDCTASDLQTGENCSVECISGLLTIASQVKSYCADDDVAETSIIGVFLLGKGPETLCSNIAATTIGSGHTSTTSTSQSSTEKTSSTTTRETSSQSTTDAGTTIIAGTSTTAEASSTAAASTTSTASSTDDTSTSAAETTAAATTTAADSSSESSAAATSSSAASTSSAATDLASLNDGSGGGSPFDLALGNGSPGATASASLAGTVMGAWALLLVLFFS